MRLRTLLVVVAVCLVVSSPTFAQNLVTNNSFETGDFTGWTTGGNFEFTSVVSGSYSSYSGAQDGLYYAVSGAVGSPATISQAFATQAGVQYTFSFWMASVGDDPSAFTAYWDNTPVLSLTDPSTGGAWTLYSFTETGTGSDSITFALQDDPAYIALDNIVVSGSTTTTAGSTPEPSTLLLLGTGLVGFGAAVRRRML